MWATAPNRGRRRPEHNDRNQDIEPRCVAPDYPDRTVIRAGRAPLFGSHLPAEKAISVLHHIAEGNGVRKTVRLVGVNRQTVARYGKKAGSHAAGLHDELVAVSPSDP
jgi:hypothetical protein